MLGHFNNLLMTTATDGASAAIAVADSRATDDDIDQIMDAWYRERQERIEAGLFLDQARELLGRIVSEGRITSVNRRRARRLLLAIKAAGHESSR